MANRHSTPDSGFVVSPDRPLIGVTSTEEGRRVVRYFADETAARAAISSQDVAEARELAGVWSDLDWEDAVERLDRIRHESEPTPPTKRTQFRI